MTCEYDPDLGDDEGVTFGCSNTGAWVRVWNRHRPCGEADGIHVCVEVGAANLRGAVHEVPVWDDGLTRFLDDLAESFGGWEGARSWRTPDRDLEVDAVFRSGGHVEMTWTVRPWQRSVSRWTASVVLTVEAGEQLRTLTAGVYRFLRPDDPA